MVSCESLRLGFTEIFTLTGVLLIAMVVYTICTFLFYIRLEIKDRKRYGFKPNVKNKCDPIQQSAYCGFVFALFTLMALSFEVTRVFQTCSTHESDHHLVSQLKLIFVLQINLLLPVWYLQLNHILSTTQYKLSRCRTVIVFTVFVLSIFFIISAVYIPALTFILCALILYLFHIVFVLHLLLYHYKRCQTDSQKHYLLDGNSPHTKHGELVPAIVKLISLYAITIITSMVSFLIVSLLMNTTDNVTASFLIYFAILFKLFTDFVAFILSYHPYEPYYQTSCACCHKQCPVLLNHCLCVQKEQDGDGKKESKQNEKTLESKAAQKDTSTTTKPDKPNTVAVASPKRTKQQQDEIVSVPITPITPNDNEEIIDAATEIITMDSTEIVTQNQDPRVSTRL
eukprot:101843_1